MLALVLAGILAAGCERTDRAAPAAAPKRITTAGGIEMVLLPGGQFLMGSAGGEADERPVRAVRLEAFCIDAREVTQRAYEELMGVNPSKFNAPDRPVERVSWRSAVKYCNARSLAEGLTPCYDEATGACDLAAAGYRLPTEAEWEYACRAGSATAYCFGDDPAGLRRFAWFKATAAGSTQPVAEKQPNAWGLYDMHGNVMEWCQDYHADGYAPAGPVDNPRGPATGSRRVLRGGCWQSDAPACRSAARASQDPAFADACFGSELYGFRCVKRAP